MADPLQKDDFRYSPADEELEESRGKVMAYQARRQDPIRRRATVSGINTEIDIASPDWQLPERGNPRLNRAAEQVGGAIGRVVSQVRRVPDSARQRLHLVRDRAEEVTSSAADRISGSASLAAAQQRVRDFASTAQDKASDLMDKVEERGRAALDEVGHLSKKAAARAEQMRMRGQRIMNDHPLEILGCIAGAAFLAGVSLRIVRAKNARRY